MHLARFHFGLFPLLVSILFYGCSFQNPARSNSSAASSSPTAAAVVAKATASPSPALEVAAAYPAPEEMTPVGGGQGGYPGPLQETEASDSAPLPIVEPTPSAHRGNVRGEARNLVGQDEPLADYILYLAQMLYNVEGNPSSIVRVNEADAPKAVTDREGRFFFGNIEPGVYALVLGHPVRLLLARDVASNQDVVFEVKAGEVTDLGTITVSIAQ